jgi:hypothetical protein
MAKGSGGGGRRGRIGDGFRIGQRVTDGLVTGRIVGRGSIRMGKRELPAFRIQTSSGRNETLIRDQTRRAVR